MAKEDIVFKVSVDEKGKSLSDLKKEFRDLQTEVSNATKGTEQYYKSLQKLASVKDEMEDLREEITGLQDSGKFKAFGNVASSIAGGFQAATSAAALFGVQSEEVEKTLLKVQAAMALTQGIQSLEGLAQAFTVVGTVIKTQVITALSTLKGALIATGIGAAVVALGALVYAANEYNEALEDEFNKQTKVNEALKEATELYEKTAIEREKIRDAQKGGLNDLERELKLMEARGATEEQLFKQKLAIFDREIFNLGVRKATVEGNVALETKYEQELQDKKTARQVLELQFLNKQGEEYKKYLAEKKKADDEYYALGEAENQERLKIQLEAQEANRKQNKELEDKQREEDFAAFMADEEKRLARIEERKKLEAEDRAKALQAEKDLQNAKLALQNATFEAARGLSDLYFADQLDKVKGNSVEETKIRKKQFEVDKAFSIARATIDGYRAVMAALTIPPPAGQILAAANGILAAATIAKISATRFDGGASSTPSTGLPSTGSSIPQVQTQNSANTPVRNDITFLDQNGNNLSKVYVTETDITRTQNRVNKIKTRATF